MACETAQTVVHLQWLSETDQSSIKSVPEPDNEIAHKNISKSTQKRKKEESGLSTKNFKHKSQKRIRYNEADTDDLNYVCSCLDVLQYPYAQRCLNPPPNSYVRIVRLRDGRRGIPLHDLTKFTSISPTNVWRLTKQVDEKEKIIHSIRSPQHPNLGREQTVITALGMEQVINHNLSLRKNSQLVEWMHRHIIPIL